MASLNMAGDARAPYEMIPNPHFSFPAQPADPMPSSHGPRRAASLHLNQNTPQRVTALERRSASTLPTFSFNASDTTGRLEQPGGSLLPEAPLSVDRGGFGHRRGASEYVGGTSKYGPPGLVNTTPLKHLDTSAFPTGQASQGSPVRKRGHAHRRSAAVSTNDIQSILQPRDTNIPSAQGDDAFQSKFAPPPQTTESSVAGAESTAAPAYAIPRPRVGFSTNIEYIPRPLSTISSEAESIASTSNQLFSTSAGSPLNPANFSPSAKRKSRSARSSLSEVESVSPSRSSQEGRAPLEREGHLLKTRLERPMTDSSATPRFTSSVRDFSFPPRTRPVSLDRRSSEPSLSFASLQIPRPSSRSLRESSEAANGDGPAKAATLTRKSSANRVKAWASSMVHRKERKRSKQAVPADAEDQPETPVSTATETPVSEPDLEELFTHDPFSQPEDESSRTHAFTSRDMENLRDFQPTYGSSTDADPVIDLDAALGPNKTPSKSPGFGARRQLHSSRASRDFISPGNILHRRAESAPTLTPFDYAKSPSPQHSPMADVFEEEEEEDNAEKTDSPGDATPTPIFSFPAHPIDADMDPTKSPSASSDGLGIQDGAFSYPSMSPMIQTYSNLPVVEDTIMEEIGPIDIVEAHEEPRASMITKSSDSSDTLTLMADAPLSLAPPHPPFMAPSLYSESTVSTPDTNRRQGSFETSRVGTSASSATDCRTLSSSASERPDTRVSVDDVPSLTSSRSTMISSMHASRRDITDQSRTPRPRRLASSESQETRRSKRSSIVSLTKLMTGPFSESKSKLSLEHGNASSPNLLDGRRASSGRKRENRLSKLMFWKTKGTKDVMPQS